MATKRRNGGLLTGAASIWLLVVGAVASGVMLWGMVGLLWWALAGHVWAVLLTVLAGWAVSRGGR